MQILGNKHNPLMIETGNGLFRVGQFHLDYLNYLLIQAAVLFLWWPKSSLSQQLDAESGPNTLLAVLIAFALTLAYHSLRAGAEEVLLPGQQPLRQWSSTPSLSTGAIVRGYIGAQSLLMAHALFLSAPLILMAYTASPCSVQVLLCCVLTALLPALCYRLLAALLYWQIGQRETLMYLLLRLVFAGGYLLGALIPLSSQIMLSAQLLNMNSSLLTVPTDVNVSAMLTGFILFYSVLFAVLTGLLYFVINRQRPANGPPTARQQHRLRS